MCNFIKFLKGGFSLSFFGAKCLVGKRVRDSKGAVGKVLLAKLRSRKAEPWIARPQAHRRWDWGNTLIIILIIFSFFSCSQGTPDVVRTDCTVVFSYDNENDVPDSRLSVFLQSQSDVRRCERIKVHSISGKYLWETNKIKKIATGPFKWAGNCNFLVPEGKYIPDGAYEITYINADEEQQISYANIKYDKNIYDLKAGDVGDYMKNRGTLNLGIFSKDDILLFFGEPEENFSTKADMLDRYNNASYYRNVWVAHDNSVICILPRIGL